MSRPKRGRTNRAWWLLSLVVLLLGGTALAADAARLWTEKHVTAFRTEIKQVETALATAGEDPAGAVSQAQQHLAQARAELDLLQPVAGPLLGLAGLPLVGRPVDQLAQVWRFADEAVNAGQSLLIVAHFGLLTLEEGSLPALLEEIPRFQQHLRQAESSFTRAQYARDRIGPVTWLPQPLQADLDAALDSWDKLAAQLELGIASADHLAWVLTTLLDAKRPMTYLLIVQSSDNLRATGGFLTGVGTVEIERGQITSVTLNEVTEVEERRKWTREDWVRGVSGAGIIPPPQPVTRYLGLGHWVMRDANWWADFPATARQVASFYTLVHQTHLDGVIALNDQAVAALLRAVGPVEIDNGKIVSADNLKATSISRIYYGDEGAANQSMFFQELGFALMALSENLTPNRLLHLSYYLKQQTRRHDLMITSFDPEIQAVLHLLGIDGSLQGQQDDYLYLVMDDLSDTKLSPYIQQELAYEVWLGPGGRPLLATLSLSQTNTYSPDKGGEGYPDGYYDGERWNPVTRKTDTWPGYFGGYLRLFLPRGSQFIEATGLDDSPDIGTESGRAVIGGYAGLHPGDQRYMQFKWIPAGTPAGPHQYRLLVQRQPGAPARPLSVTVHLLTDYQVRATEPPAELTDNAITWQTTLDQDRSFALSFEGEGAVLLSPPAELLETLNRAAAAHQADAPGPAATPRAVAAAPLPPPGRAPQPVWISIPAIGVSAPVVPVGLEPSGIMASPAEADLVGWYEYGPRPGEASNAILAGHVDWMGQSGSFARLHELQPGDFIEVESGPNIKHRYVVDRIDTYQADQAPLDQIFGETQEPVLTLITCGGPYDSVYQEYRDRLVIRARGQ